MYKGMRGRNGREGEVGESEMKVEEEGRGWNRGKGDNFGLKEEESKRLIFSTSLITLTLNDHKELNRQTGRQTIIALAKHTLMNNVNNAHM